jgi:hypothetical protein
MIPGIYEFELDLVMKQGAGSAGDDNGPFYLDLISGDGTDTPVQIYPTTSDDNYQIKTGKVGVGNYSAGGSKENPQGVASLRALVTIPSTTTVKFRSQIRSYPNSAARNSKYTGDMAFSITRISNLDGTETTIR